MDIDLTELANIKIKLDIYEKMYKEKSAVIRQQLSTLPAGERTAQDTANGLILSLSDSGTRDFSIEGVKEILGADASRCIEEKISVKDFDSITKKGTTLTKEQQARCFYIIPKTALTWDGLDVYKEKLANKTTKK